MATVSKADLPADWRTQHGEAIIVELARQIAAIPRSSFRYQMNFGDGARMAPILNNDMLSARLNTPTVVQLYNSAAFCYVVRLNRSWEDRHCFVDGGTWLPEVFDAWTGLCSADAIDDNRQAFACVKLTREESAEVRNWIGLCFASGVSEADKTKAQEAGLTSLISRHRRLCDLVSERAYGPSRPEDEGQLSDVLAPMRLAYYHPAFTATCRAVMIIAPNCQDSTRAVLLVLTGDTERLKSAPPSFDSNPMAQILKRRSDIYG